MFWICILLMFTCSAIGRIVPSSSISNPVLKQPSDQSRVAISSDHDHNSILQQPQLNVTESNLGCTSHPTWFRSWTDHMHAQYYVQACNSARKKMKDPQGKPRANYKIEFLSEHATPSTPPWGGYKMRTPLRYVATENGKTCTVAVAMLTDVPPGTISNIPMGPYFMRDYVTFRTLDGLADLVLRRCMQKRGEDAEFGWAKPGIASSRGIIVLVMGTDSQMDRDLPLEPDPEPDVGAAVASS